MPSDQETPPEILNRAFERAKSDIGRSLITDEKIRERVELVSQNQKNGAVVRLLLACTLAKSHNPHLDIRKPYTEIGDSDDYSGRSYDETYLQPFIMQHGLPCNNTTAFLTPAFRTKFAPLTPETNLQGRHPALYGAVLQLLTDVQTGAASAEDVLAEAIRSLLVLRNRRREQMELLLAGLRSKTASIPLSSEAIHTLLEQHLKSPRSSRLPVLMVAAAYQAAGARLGETASPLERHNAADLQTGAVGDVEVTIADTNAVVTGYEMKNKRVTRDDIDIALQKIIDKDIHNYIFITTDVIDREVREYAAGLYEQTGGVEIVVLDCLDFLRYFLHLFHRSRIQFLEAYQTLVLGEPESAVGQPLKVAWLALRQAAESEEDNG